jgi:hypothetical protein
MKLTAPCCSKPDVSLIAFRSQALFNEAATGRATKAVDFATTAADLVLFGWQNGK